MTEQVQFINRFEKDNSIFVLWRKGNYWYELTSSSQIGRYESIKEWYDVDLEEIKNELKSGNYKQIG